MNIRIKLQESITGFTIPCEEGEINWLCEVIGIQNNSQTLIRVDSVSGDDRANALFKGKTVNLDKLNYLAKRMDSFSKNELTTFYAVAYEKKLDNMDSLINLTFNTHCASVVTDFKDFEAIGRSMYLTEQGEVPIQELNRLDGERHFKKVLADNQTPAVTPYGIVYGNKNQYEQVFDGVHFPEYQWQDNLGTAIISYGGQKEYLYLPFKETEVKKALERLGIEDIKEVEVKLDSEILTDKIIAAITEGEAVQEKLQHLSDFSKRFEEIGVRENPHLDFLVEHLNPKNEKDLNVIMDSMHEFEVFHGIGSAKEYGRYMICDSGHFEYDDNLCEYINFEKYGAHRLMMENGAFVKGGYLLYQGYNMELGEMLNEIGIEVKQQEIQVLKLYMPIKGRTYYEENDYGDFYQVDYETEIYPEELTEYEDEILAALAKNSLAEKKERGLMTYYESSDLVNAKVKRYDFSVENVDGKLMGVAILHLNEPLDDNEFKKIKETISCQASDGWGEVFEQREINCNGKEIYVNFWQRENWSLKTAEELGIDGSNQEMTMEGMNNL